MDGAERIWQTHWVRAEEGRFLAKPGQRGLPVRVKRRLSRQLARLSGDSAGKNVGTPTWISGAKLRAFFPIILVSPPEDLLYALLSPVFFVFSIDLDGGWLLQTKCFTRESRLLRRRLSQDRKSTRLN